MRRCYLLLVSLALAPVALAQLGTPAVQALYGGRISWIDAARHATTANTVRAFVSTESANSVFWADVSTASFTGTTFQAVTAFDSDDGFGSSVSRVTTEDVGNGLFVLAGGALYSCPPPYSARTTIQANGVSAIEAHDGYLLYARTNGGQQFLHFGAVSTTGVYTENAASPLLMGAFGATAATTIVVNESNNVYVFAPGETPIAVRVSAIYSLLSAATTFETVPMTGIPTESGKSYTAFGVSVGSPERIFAGRTTGSNPGTKYVAYNDRDNGTGAYSGWTGVNTGISGVTGGNVAPRYQTSGGFIKHVYFGAAVSHDNGATWANLPDAGTHPNDGAVATSEAEGLAFYTTDAGLGGTRDYGTSGADLSTGITAVQVNDFVMNAAKTIAWSASKSGVRRVTGYATGAEAWTTTFPNGDGSPYYAAEMSSADAAGNTAWAGNTRLYRTTDGGTTWTQPFTTETAAYGYPFATNVLAIDQHPNNPNLLYLGAGNDGSLLTAPVFFSENGGVSWTQVPTDSNGVSYTLRIRDVLIVPDAATGDAATVYLATQSGVRAIRLGGTAGAYTHGFRPTMTSGITPFSITNFAAYDLDRDATNGHVWACGVNVSNEPRIYRRASGAVLWELAPTAGLPATGIATACTVGEDASANKIPYMAVGAIVYYNGDDPMTGAWATTSALTYPTGTQINVLFWDALLVGTDTGLFGHSGAALPVELTAFTATTSGREVHLRWTTAAETNNAGYGIERQAGLGNGGSRSAEAWREVGWVAGHGTTGEGQRYSFTLADLEPGQHRFRLRQMDLDGTTTYSATVEAEVGMNGAYLFSVAPNPASGAATVRVAVREAQQATVMVYDALGRRVATLHDGPLGAGSVQAFGLTAELAPGVYVVRVAAEHFTASVPFVRLR